MRTEPKATAPWGSVLWIAAVVMPACAVGGYSATLEITSMDDQVAFVGSPFALPLETENAAGDRLYYRFRSNLPDLCRGESCRAGIERRDDGTAVFRWTPQTADVGTWAFDFAVSDGETVAVETVNVEVRSSVGYNGLPRFVQPLGTGTTVDVSRGECFRFDVVVDDPDSEEVRISQEAPVIEGAELDVHDAFTATWRWCPSPEQARVGHHRLVLSADDGDNPRTRKSYLLVVRRPSKPGCGGTPPDISHTPGDWSGSGRVRIEATVRADGLRHEPLLYYSTRDPGPDPELGRMIQVSMARVSGTNDDGVWEARLPNPVAALPEGATGSLYYLLTASSTDGSCDQYEQSPTSGAHEITIRNSPATAEMPGAAACAPCGADAECGGEDDRCVRMGTSGDAFCLVACEADADCPEDWTCSASAVDSVDGASSRQCVPPDETCRPEGEGCADDAYEENDALSDVSGAAVLDPGDYPDLVSCHQDDDDEDWYRIELTERSQVLATLRGGHETDIDLALVDADGEELGVGESFRSHEDVAVCADPGTYFLRVYSFGYGRNPYELGWSARTGDCDATCSPDPAEEDDGATDARPTDLSSEWSSSDNTICADDDDWYAVDLSTGETLVVELSFIQTALDEDLDLHFMAPDGTDLTPCSESDPSTCSAFQGQSVDSNEYYEHTVESDGTYHVVVHGFDGSENDYDIRMRVE